MNHLKYLVIFVIATILLSSFTSDCDTLHWGTKSLYKPLQSQYLAPPLGYKPVFINYVGRHGARHLTKNTSDSLLFLVLSAAEAEDGLTKKGQTLKRMVSCLANVEKGNYGSISLKGQQEQEAIGERMKENLSNIFAHKTGVVKISTTKKVRTQQSAQAFLKGLNLDSTFSLVNNFNDGNTLAFYDVAPAYKEFEENGSWKSSFEVIANSQKAKALNEQLVKLFFKASFVNKLNDPSTAFGAKGDTFSYSAKSFVEAYYGVCSIVASLEGEIIKAGYATEAVDFGSLVSCSQLEELDYINSAEDFLLKGPGTNALGLQVRIAAPLLLNFLTATDAFLGSDTIKANLCFAHAETLAPFTALLQITGASESVSPQDILDYGNVWQCENVIPLSANIQWILFQSEATNDVLVKFMLNEKEVAINGLPDSGTAFYYRWEDVRRFYINMLASMKVNVGDNMHEYLLNVK